MRVGFILLDKKVGTPVPLLSGILQPATAHILPVLQLGAPELAADATFMYFVKKTR
jgi:hypothetical protein